MTEGQRIRNLNVLEKRFPGISEIIEERKDQLLEQEALCVTEETAFTGEQILTVKRNGRKLDRKSTRLNSSHIH